MKFIKKLKNMYRKSHILIFKKTGLDEWRFPQISRAIEFNDDISLSVQGSYYHYCLPRRTLPYNQYKNLEFALTKNGRFVSVGAVLSSQPEGDIWCDYFDGSIYGYVPVEKIEKLYQLLKKEYGLKRK